MGPSRIDVEAQGETMRADKVWTIDKHIPVALIVSIALFVLGQTAAFSYWGASMGGRVEQLERDRAAAVVAVDSAAKSSSAFSERLVRLETKFDGAVEALAEIKSILRQPSRPAPQ